MVKRAAREQILRRSNTSKSEKWSAKVLNLVVALAMVVSLIMVFAPPIAAQEECNPTPVYNNYSGQGWTDPQGGNIKVTILSPGPNTYIATGQQFTVSAKVENDGPDDATNVTATIDPENCYSLHYVTLTNGQSDTINLGTINNGDFKVATWTLVGGGNNDWGLKDCNVRTDDICVSATSDVTDPVPSNNEVSVSVAVYPAAHLVTVIGTVTPVVNVCDEFNVSYTVYNIGQADAWNTSVTLSVAPEGSVRIAGGETGYTQMLGTIVGWDSGALEQRGNATGTFKLHCKMACESTLTLTPAGNDECGWHDDPEYYWVQFANLPIQSRCLIPASETVKQLDSGGVDLSIDKTVDNMFPTAGHMTVNFTITVTNYGPMDASGVKVTDSLPGTLTFVSATPSQGSWAAPVWTVGSIVVGGSASLVIQATATTTNPITNTASITAVDQPDPFGDNYSASVTLNWQAVTSMDIALNSGWNLISLPLIPNNSAIGVVLAGVSSQVVSVWSYSGGVWSSWDPISGGDLATMVEGKGYWITNGLIIKWSH